MTTKKKDVFAFWLVPVLLCGIGLGLFLGWVLFSEDPLDKEEPPTLEEQLYDLKEKVKYLEENLKYDGQIKIETDCREETYQWGNTVYFRALPGKQGDAGSVIGSKCEMISIKNAVKIILDHLNLEFDYVPSTGSTVKLKPKGDREADDGT